jgi:hypothetical protein
MFCEYGSVNICSNSGSNMTSSLHPSNFLVHWCRRIFQRYIYSILSLGDPPYRMGFSAVSQIFVRIVVKNYFKDNYKKFYLDSRCFLFWEFLYLYLLSWIIILLVRISIYCYSQYMFF